MLAGLFNEDFLRALRIIQPMEAVNFILFVQNQAQSRDFFSTTLQIEPRLDVPGMTEFVLLEGAVLGLMPLTSAQRLGLPHGRGGSELYLVLQNADEVIARALSVGAKQVSPLSLRPWGARVAYLTDLDAMPMK